MRAVAEGPGRALLARGRSAAVAAPHEAATRAGAAAIEAGGNAVDAALAAAAVLSVVYPHNCGIGGDLFALVALPGEEIFCVNASGAAPDDVDAAALRRAGRGALERGPHSVTVPGALSGWDVLARAARRGLAAALEPAIRHAREGAPVARSLAVSLRSDADAVLADEGLASVFAPAGRPLGRGEVFRQPALAATLETVASESGRSLYDGSLRGRAVRALRRAGSAISSADLARHAPEVVPPLAGAYRGHEVLTAPPNSQGFVLLGILSSLEREDVPPDPCGDGAAAWARLFAQGWRDREERLADPRRAAVPLDDLLSGGSRTGPGLTPWSGVSRGRPAGDTVAVVAADEEGYAVSLIQSLYMGFGSGILDPDTGILWHNRAACFSLDPASPNAIEGGKRPAHTLMPVMVRSPGRLRLVAGTMGGELQPQIHAALIARVLARGERVDEAVRAPRWAVVADRDRAEPAIPLESGVPEGARRALAGGGALVDLGDANEALGHAHLLELDPDGMKAASDPRADGCAWAS